MTQPNYIEVQLDRIEGKLDQLLARPNSGAGGSSSTPTPPEPNPTPGAQYPADVFGKNWKLTLPINGAQEIKQPALATYTSKYCELTATGGSFANNAVVFRAWHGGDTTSGSKNPRSELRETYNGDTEGYWPIEKGHHGLRIVGAVTRLTKVKPHVVVGQVHNETDDLVVWRLEANKLWLTDGNNPNAFLVDGAYQLGTPYDLQLNIDAGLATFAYNGVTLSYQKKIKGKAYFKAGLYLQSNPSTAPGESTSEYSEVVLRSVAVTHAA